MIGQFLHDRSLPVLILLSFFSLTTSTVSASDFQPVTSTRWTNKYDRYFRKYTKRFFGAGFEWRWFKAQAIAESNLNNEVKSWVNAKGVM